GRCARRRSPGRPGAATGSGARPSSTTRRRWRAERDLPPPRSGGGSCGREGRSSRGRGGLGVVAVAEAEAAMAGGLEGQVVPVQRLVDEPAALGHVVGLGGPGQQPFGAAAIVVSVGHGVTVSVGWSTVVHGGNEPKQ